MEQPTDAVEPLARLTERERLVASKSAEGLTYREIADELFIAPNTVRTHLSKIYKKLGIRNKAALIYLLNQTPQDNVNAPVSRIALPPPACPYPGMVPFQSDDAAYFYGREAEIKHMVQHLRQQPFLMLIGPSGSGKSSLVHAGLLPELAQSRYFEADYWLLRTLRPGANPSKRLAEQLETLDGQSEYCAHTIQRLLARHAPAQQVLLLIDQFEEVFTQADRGQQQRFINAINVLRTLESCSLLLTMRADFYPDLMISELWPVDASQRVEITPLRGEALRAAIEKPATAVGVSLEESLVNQLLADAAEEPGVLPLLQETMSQLWLEMEQRVLSYHAYEKLSRNGASTTTDSASSGLAVAIASKADHTLAELKPPQQLIARRIFLRLIQFGEGRADTRRQQPVSALQALGDDQNAFDYTLEHLTDHRLLTRSGADEDEDSRVDIAHESLISSWTRLQDWVEERREAEQVRRRLDAKAAEWVRLGQGSGGLLDEAALPEAERWLASPDADELGFDATLPELVKASQQAIADAKHAQEVARQRELAQAQALIDEKTRAAGRMRRSMIGLAAVMLVAVAAGLFAWVQSQKAQSLAVQEAAARQTAENARLSSIAQLLLNEAQEQQAIDLDERGALLARQAYLFTTASRRSLQEQVDGVLRSVIAKPYFSALFSQKSTQSVALSPDGLTLAAAQIESQGILLWNLARPGSSPTQLPGYPGDPTGRVYALAFSPDGKMLAAGNEKGMVNLWQIEQPHTAPRELATHSGVWSVAFSPDSRYLAAGANQTNAFQLWDLDNPEIDPLLIPDPQTTATEVTPPAKELGVPVVFSPDGTRFASAGTHGTIHLWDPKNLATPLNSLRGHEGGVFALAFSADSQTLASAGQDTLVRLWGLNASSTPPVVLSGDGKPVISLAFSPDGELLVSSGYGSGNLLRRIKSLYAPPYALLSDTTNVSFSADGKRMASARTGENGVRFWDLTSSSQPVVISGYKSAVWSLAFSPDGETLASSGGHDKIIRLWDLTDLAIPPRNLQSPDMAMTVAFSPDGQWLAVSGGEDNTVRVWALGKNLVQQAVLTGTDKTRIDEPFYVTFSPDGKFMASGSGQGVFLWNPADLSAEPHVIDFGASWLIGLAFSPDSQLLAVAGEDGFVYLQTLTDLQTAAVKWQEHESRVHSIAFSPDGTKLVSGGRDATIRLWDPHAPEKPSKLIGRLDASVSRVRFSLDGKRLASTSLDHSLRLWNMEDLDAVPALLLDEKSSFLSVRFSPDGNTMATGSWDGTIRLWDINHPLLRLSTTGIAERVCEKVWRNLTLDEWHKFIGVDIPYQRTCSNLPIHPSLFEAAEKLAKAGDKDGAVALLERALELDSDLTWNSQEEAERLATSAGQ